MLKKLFTSNTDPVETTEETTLETPHTVQEGESIQVEGVEGDLPVGTVIEEAPAEKPSEEVTPNEEAPTSEETEKPSEEVSALDFLCGLLNATKFDDTTIRFAMSMENRVHTTELKRAVDIAKARFPQAIITQMFDAVTCQTVISVKQ